MGERPVCAPLPEVALAQRSRPLIALYHNFLVMSIVNFQKFCQSVKIFKIHTARYVRGV